MDMKAYRILKCLVITTCISFAVENCAAKHMFMPPVSMVKPDSLLKITDEDIRQAFALKPQLIKPLVVAIYNASFDDHALLDSIEKFDDIRSAFAVSPWLIEGDEYKFRKESPWYDRYREPRTTPIKAVRLEAAKGKADMLIYCGITHTYKEETNRLAWAYLGLITIPIVPGQQYKLRTEVDLFFIDVRNGYMYGTYHDEIIDEKKYVPITFSESAEFEEVKRNQVQKLMPGIIKAVQRILDNNEFYLKKGKAPADTSMGNGGGELIPIEIEKKTE
jgi:hypothetical protein